jgi:Xaa-Pro aminopeptidase
LIPAAELEKRLIGFRKKMDELNEGWEVAFVVNKINIFYLTGTLQNGVLVIPKNGDAVFFVRRSYERAKIESGFPKIIKISSFRDISPVMGNLGETVYIEKEFLTLAYFERLNKYFSFKNIKSCDLALSAARAVKTEYEIDLLKKAGDIHNKTLTEFVPSVLKEGISEKEVGAEMLKFMLDNGHHGVSRIGMFNTELYTGQVCFGDNGVYYNTFDGPGGVKGICPAVPLFGNPERKLKKNELISIDMGCGVEGYHTDKTQAYAFGELTDEVYEYHEKCVEIINKAASLMKPGAIPSAVYEEAVADLDDDFVENFMGMGAERVKFLGHGVGLVIDEYPVFAKGFDLPLEENMVMALEPKRGIAGVGLTGLEDTYIVTKEGGVCITGTDQNIIQV